MACTLHVAWGGRLAKPPYRRPFLGAADTAADQAAWCGGNPASFAERETPVAGQRNRAASAGWQARFAPWLRATLRSEHAYRRLRRIKASLDPHDMIRYNNPVPPVQRQFT